jgi:hypothetical protein
MYPETTGYIIRLLDFRIASDSNASKGLADGLWETRFKCRRARCRADRFVPPTASLLYSIQGWSSRLYCGLSATKAPVSGASRLATGSLMVGHDGHFQTHGKFVSQHRYKTYNCLCAWPLYRFGEDVCDIRCKAAVKEEVRPDSSRRVDGFRTTVFQIPTLRYPTLSVIRSGILEVGYQS